GADLRSPIAKRLLQSRRLGCAQQPGVLEHANVRDRRFDVLRRKANVDGQAARKRDRLRGRRRVEPPTPQWLVGLRAGWIRLAHRRPCRADHTFSGMPHNRMKPSAWRWSKASSGPYVARPTS